MPNKQIPLSNQNTRMACLSPQQALERSKQHPLVLSQANAQLRLEKDGANRSKPPKPKRIVIRFAQA